MLQISNALKAKFLEADGQKIFSIVFPELSLTIDNNNIYADSIALKESIMEGSSIEFVGCISSTFSCELNGINSTLKGKRIEVYVTIEGFTEQIPLFKGYVDSIKTRLTDSYKSITCYDDLYYKIADKDVASWYKGLSFPITIKNFRDSLFSYLGIAQVSATLVNDSISIAKQYDPSTMNALDMIKNICQLNGVFGVLNRYGNFEYKTLGVIGDAGTYPAMYTYPAVNLYPTGQIPSLADATITNIGYYSSMMYEDYDVYAISKVIVRPDDKEAGVSYGNGDNCYIVQGNVFTVGLSDETKTTIAHNIYNNVKGLAYKPFDSECLGLPYLECGDIVSFNIADYSSGTPSYVTKEFYIMQRSIKGIQALKDSYSADGEQYQKTFISDLRTQLDSVKTQVASAVTYSQMASYVGDYAYSKDETIEAVENEIEQMETPTGFTVVSCTTLPATRASNTIYLVRGDVTIV